MCARVHLLQVAIHRGRAREALGIYPRVEGGNGSGDGKKRVKTERTR